MQPGTISFLQAKIRMDDDDPLVIKLREGWNIKDFYLRWIIYYRRGNYFLIIYNLAMYVTAFYLQTCSGFFCDGMTQFLWIFNCCIFVPLLVITLWIDRTLNLSDLEGGDNGQGQNVKNDEQYIYFVKLNSPSGLIHISNSIFSTIFMLVRFGFIVFSFDLANRTPKIIFSISILIIDVIIMSASFFRYHYFNRDLWRPVEPYDSEISQISQISV